jgi:type VI protein secretion system component VasK
VGALRSLVARIRANPWLAVGIAVAALLVIAWLAWAIYVASDRGVNEGLGVLVAWPAMVAALALISLPFIGIYLLVKRTATDGETGEQATEEQGSDEQEQEDEEEEEEDADEGNGEDEEEEPEEGDEDEPEADADEKDVSDSDADEESEQEPETATS